MNQRNKTRLLRVAKYLGSRGFYKEAAQIKKIAESPIPMTTPVIRPEVADRLVEQIASGLVGKKVTTEDGITKTIGNYSDYSRSSLVKVPVGNLDIFFDAGSGNYFIYSIAFRDGAGNSPWSATSTGRPKLSLLSYDDGKQVCKNISPVPTLTGDAQSAYDEFLRILLAGPSMDETDSPLLHEERWVPRR